MSKKKIIFMGTPDFAAYILEQLMETKNDLFEIIAVISQPDKAVGRKRILTSTPVKEMAMKYNLPIMQPEKIGAIYDELVALQPDLLITAAYGQLVPEKILNIPTYRCINVHGSLLPKYRGGAPIHRAIIAGEKETGITIMYMEKALDAGDMLAKRSVAIGVEDTLESMYATLQVIGAKLLLEMLPDFFAGNIVPEVQDKEQVTYAPNIKKEETRINWNMSATDIFNHVRGLYPAPATNTTLSGNVIKIFSVKVLDVPALGKPGEIVAVSGKTCDVSTGNGVISLQDLQISGRKRQNIQDTMNGFGKTLFIVGERFE